jgi:hypothetical protein
MKERKDLFVATCLVRSYIKPVQLLIGLWQEISYREGRELTKHENKSGIMQDSGRSPPSEQ